MNKRKILNTKMNNLPKIILLSGAKRSGKDTFANYLEEHYGYKHIKITTKLKNCIKILFDLEDEDLEDNKELVNPEWKVTPRRIMQFMGTEMFQNKIQELIPNIGKTFWIKSLLNNELITKLMTNKEYKIVISDLRFIHELEEIKKINIQFFHIRINNNNLNYTIDNHISENEFYKLKYDYVINNNNSIYDYYYEIEKLMNGLIKI